MTQTRRNLGLVYWLATLFGIGQFVFLLLATTRNHWTEGLFWLVLMIWTIEKRDQEAAA